MKACVTIASLSLALALALPGCATGGSPRFVPTASNATNARFDAMKKLVGRWDNVDSAKDAAMTSEFTLIAGGSVLVERMFPGTPHEMVNTFYIDGDSIVGTHYCAMGNQPRMKLVGGSDTDFPFVSTGVTNLHSTDQTYMMDVHIVMHGADRYTATWHGMEKGKIGENTVFEKQRAK